MIVLVAGERRAPALDRIAEKDGRPVIVGSIEGLAERGEAVTSEILHQPGEFGVGAALDQGRCSPLVAEIVEKPLAPRRAALKDQCGVKGIGARVDPLLQCAAAGFLEGGALQQSILELHHAPAKGREDRLDAAPQTFAHDAVEALPVVVDQPPDISQIVFPALLQGFVNIAFVEFGVANQGHHSAIHRSRPAMSMQVVLNDRREDRQRRPEPHRARGEIHVVRVLGPGRIALDATKSAKVLQLFERHIAHEILHGVEDGTRMWLHRHAIIRPQRMKIEGGHHGGHGGGRCLMPAHLHVAFGLRSQVIGVVNCPAGQPEQDAVDVLEGAEIGHLRFPLFLARKDAERIERISGIFLPR